MSIHIDEVLDYLDTHLVCRNADSVGSLMEALHEIYTAYTEIDNEELRGAFEQLGPLFESLPPADSDLLFGTVCDLCMKHEQLAFSQGVLTGMMLMTEVNRLP